MNITERQPKKGDYFKIQTHNKRMAATGPLPPPKRKAFTPYVPSKIMLEAQEKAHELHQHPSWGDRYEGKN